MQGYQYCWVVDPLDGTKEFIKRNGEFTVMIALVQVCRLFVTCCLPGSTCLQAATGAQLCCVYVCCALQPRCA